MMVKKRLVRKSAVSLLAAVCVISQTGTAWAAGPGEIKKGTWQYESGDWKYYESAGNAALGWIETETGWYYLNPSDGKMSTGWQQIDGKNYYFNQEKDGIAGQMRSGWFQDSDLSWFFMNTVHDGTFGSTLTGWHWIDGYCYYFEESGSRPGRMYAGETTPDGFLTNAEGRWIEHDGTVHYEAGRGISSTEQAAETVKSVGSSGSGSGGSGSSGSGSGSGSGNDEETGSGTDEETGGSNEDNNGGNGNDEVNNGGNNGGSDSGNNGGNTDSGDEGQTKPGDVLVNEQRTKLLDLGWIQYVVIGFESGDILDYTVSIDGTDVTASLTKVDDEGAVVKWESTVVNPEMVTVVRKSDQKEQKVKIGSKSASEVPEAGNAESAPAAILANGPVSSFDYYLDVYDSDGNVRTEPKLTTFDLTGRRNEKPAEIPTDYYVPDTLIDQEEGNGEIIVKLSLKTEEQEAWFNGLGTVRALDTENGVLNDNLSYTKQVESEAYGKTGKIRIQLPQTNLFSRGRYQIHLSSGYSSAAMTVPVHLVDNRLFTMQLNTLNTNPKPGECFAFVIKGPEGETFGTEVLSPIYRVDLTAPSGNVTTLEEFTEWYEIGDMLHICGTNTDEEIITKESGIYKITVYSDGYQIMTKSVEIRDSGSKSGYNTLSAVETYGIDAVSSASVGGGSDSSGDSDSSGSLSINAFLIFDHDLLANAMILEELEIGNQASEAVLARWSDMTPVSVMDEEAEELYDFISYLNAVKDAKLDDGKSLSFTRYAEAGDGVTKDRPYQVKRVLEDGLLGSTFRFNEVVGKKAPQLEGLGGAFGNDIVIRCSVDPAYLSAVTALYLDNGAIELRNDDYLSQYSYDETEDTLTIYSTTKGTAGGSVQLTGGTHSLRLMAEGYQTANVILTVENVQEMFELALVNPNPSADEEAEDPSVYYTGQDVYVSAASSETDEDQKEIRGDFMKKLTGITLKSPEGKSSVVTSETEGTIGGNDNYIREAYGFILQKGLFEEAGEYMVTVRADGYTPKVLEFTVEKSADQGGQETEVKTPPEVTAQEYVEAGFLSAGHYRITFDSSDEAALKEYLNSEEFTVTVNGAPYEKVVMGLYDNQTAAFKVSKDSFAVEKYLDLSEDGFTEKDNLVVIEAKGYEPLEFVVTLDGNTDEMEAVLMVDYELVKKSFMYAEYYKVTFDTTDEAASKAYLENDTLTVTVNGDPYTKVSMGIYDDDEYSFKVSRENGVVKYLELTSDGFTEGDNTVILEAEGYEIQEFVITVEEKSVLSGSDVLADPASKADTDEVADGDVLIPEAGETGGEGDGEAAETPENGSGDEEAAEIPENGSGDGEAAKTPENEIGEEENTDVPENETNNEESADAPEDGTDDGEAENVPEDEMSDGENEEMPESGMDNGEGVIISES